VRTTCLLHDTIFCCSPLLLFQTLPSPSPLPTFLFPCFHSHSPLPPWPTRLQAAAVARHTSAGAPLRDCADLYVSRLLGMRAPPTAPWRAPDAPSPADLPPGAIAPDEAEGPLAGGGVCAGSVAVLRAGMRLASAAWRKESLLRDPAVCRSLPPQPPRFPVRTSPRSLHLACDSALPSRYVAFLTLPPLWVRTFIALVQSEIPVPRDLSDPAAAGQCGPVTRPSASCPKSRRCEHHRPIRRVERKPSLIRT